jgi:excisionase family DNA binding protein
VSDLHALLSAELAAALWQLVDERVAAALESQGVPDAGTPWLTIAEAAERLRISERQLHRWLERGRVRSSAIGRRRLLHRDDLDELARSGDGGGSSANHSTPSPRPQPNARGNGI